MSGRSGATTYGKRRYLEKAAPELLDIREKDLSANTWTTNSDGSVRAILEPARRQFFFTKLIELQAERQLRAGVGDIQFDETAITRLASRDYTPSRLRTPPSLPASPFLVRYSNERYIKDALNKGVIKINPATTYADPSLNSAQYDEELRHFSVTPHERIPFKLFGTDTSGGAERELPYQPLELFRYMEVPNFYVLCCAASFDCRMFNDFTADTALIIHGKEEFIRRVGDAVSKHVPRTFSHGKVRYYDPYITARASELIPAFSKHFRYAYQDEYRLVWKPSSGMRLDPFFINIGPVSDIAAIVELVSATGCRRNFRAGLNTRATKHATKRRPSHPRFVNDLNVKQRDRRNSRVETRPVRHGNGRGSASPVNERLTAGARPVLCCPVVTTHRKPNEHDAAHEQGGHADDLLDSHHGKDPPAIRSLETAVLVRRRGAT